MGEKLLFGVFALVLIGALLRATRETKSKLFGGLLLGAMLICSATYLFRFGDLSSFSLSAFSSQAQFIREKKKEVSGDVEEIKRLKTESEKQAGEIQHAKDRILNVEKEAKQALPENRPVTQLMASLKLVIRGHAPFPWLQDKKDSQGNAASLSLGALSRWQPGKRGTFVCWMSAKESQCWSSTTEATYYADFSIEPVTNNIHEQAGEFLKSVDLFEVFPSFLPLNTHIDGGTLTVTVNSVLAKSLPIPPQTFELYHDIQDEWSVAHPSGVVELTPSPTSTTPRPSPSTAIPSPSSTPERSPK